MSELPAPDLGAVKRLHDAANDPTYSSPRVRRADIQTVVRLVDAQAAQLADAAVALHECLSRCGSEWVDQLRAVTMPPRRGEYDDDEEG